MSRIRRQGFTIVEMLMVIGVLAILMGIVTTAASAAIRQARDRKTAAVKQVIQAGIATYYSQQNEWPPKKGGQLKQWADNGLGTGKHVDFLSADQYDDVMYELAYVSVGTKTVAPVMDVNGIPVAVKSSAGRAGARGMEFAEAVKREKKHGATIKLNNMAFGYLTSDKGYFRRFIIQYNADSDSVTVMTRSDYESWWNVANSGRSVQWPNGYSL